MRQVDTTHSSNGSRHWKQALAAAGRVSVPTEYGPSWSRYATAALLCSGQSLLLRRISTSSVQCAHSNRNVDLRVYLSFPPVCDHLKMDQAFKKQLQEHVLRTWASQQRQGKGAHVCTAKSGTRLSLVACLRVLLDLEILEFQPASQRGEQLPRRSSCWTCVQKSLKTSKCSNVHCKWRRHYTAAASSQHSVVDARSEATRSNSMGLTSFVATTILICNYSYVLLLISCPHAPRATLAPWPPILRSDAADFNYNYTYPLRPLRQP